MNTQAGRIGLRAGSLAAGLIGEHRRRQVKHGTRHVLADRLAEPRTVARAEQADELLMLLDERIRVGVGDLEVDDADARLRRQCRVDPR